MIINYATNCRRGVTAPTGGSEIMSIKFNALRPLKLFVVVTGIAALGGYVFFSLQAWAAQSRLERQFEREVAAHRSDEQFRGANKTHQPPQPQQPDNALAKLDIPKAGLSVMVTEGVDDATLRVAVGHIPGTRLPGQAGNVGLAGHRDSFFRGLSKVRIGDEITLTTQEAMLHYTVESVRIVSPDDVSVLQDTSYPALTLVTCYPFYYVGPAPQRWIVKARMNHN
jgi:LPXTG-site transpeptidase (sortase) family protein